MLQGFFHVFLCELFHFFFFLWKKAAPNDAAFHNTILVGFVTST